MKKLLWLTGLLALSGCTPNVMRVAFPQNIEGQAIASQYGQFQLQGTATNSFVFTPASCQVAAGNKNVAALTQGVPVRVVDPGNHALDETVIAGLVNINACSVQLAVSNTHVPPFYVTSGTAGLQEAINANAAAGPANTIIIDAGFYALGGTTGIITSVTGGSTNLGLVDITTTPYTWYAWSGSAYAKVSVGGGGNPGGTSGAIQTNSNGSFGGSVITGLVKGNGTSAPTAAVPGTDYQTPIANSCTGGITCPLVGSTYSFNYSGGAGTGSVGAGSQYQNSFYPNSGSTTAVGATSNEATLPVGLSSSQISSVLSGQNLAVTLQPGAAPVPFVNTNHNPIHDDNTVVPAEPWNMRASGAVCDTQFITASITKGSTTITAAGTPFTTAINDGATWIETVGADPNTGEPIRFDATLTYVSSDTATLSAAAPFTSASGSFYFGHQDNAAIADAISVGLATGRQVNAPNGNCWTSVPQRFGANIVGHGSILAGFGEAEQGTVFLGSAGEDVFQSSLAVGAAPAGMNSGNYTITLAPAIDATKPWEICGPTSSCTQQTPLYRPIGILGPDAQDPLAPQWIEGPNTAQYNTGAINGLAFVMNGSNSFTVAGSQTAPSVGETVVFPYLSTIFSGTVASVSGRTVTLDSGQNYPGSTVQPLGTITGCALSVSGNTYTATFTATNSLASGDVVGVLGLTTTACKQLNGYAWTVLSAGLSPSQFEAQSTNFTQGTAESPTSDTGSFFAPFPAATEWFAGTSFQNIQTSIPATGRTFPMTIALANPIIPIPALEAGASPAGVAPFGYVQIDGEQCAYYGNSNYPASAASISTPTITLQGCAQNGTTAAAHSVGAIIVPLNPFEPTWPWPATPTVMSGLQSPVDAEFFPAQGVGNAAISFPVPNGTEYAPSIGMGNGHLHNILINIGGGGPASSFAGDQIQNDTAAMYIAVQPFASTISDIWITSTFYGIVEGAPSTNTDNYFRNGFPTADGNHWINIFDQSSALPMDIISEGSGMFSGLTFFSESFAPPNNYIPGFTPGTDDGAQGNLILDSPFDDQLNGYPYANTGVQFTTFQFKYLEPETGFFNQTQPLDYWNCAYCTWINTTPKGSGVRFINGEFQQYYGGTLNINATTPIVLTGSHIDFEHVIGMGSSYLGVTYGSSAVLNWGPTNTAYGPGDNVAGTVAGPDVPQLSGGIAPVLGQTDDTLATGNTAIPYVAARGLGYFSPDQIPPSTLDPAPMTGTWTFDPTSPISNAYVSCAGPQGYSCTPTHMTGDFVIIGPNQRIVAGPYYGHVSFKTPNGATSFTFRLFALSNGSCTGTGGYSTTITTPDSGWHDYPIPLADFTGDAGCLFTPNLTNGDAAFDIELGYLDLVPMPSSMMLPITTPREGAACNLPGSLLGSDANYIYICASGGTVKRVGIS